MDNMNDQELTQLRIRVAELCGWTHLRVFSGYLWGYFGHNPNWSAGCLGDTLNVPDYPNDLNACAKFEKGLSKEQKEVYTCNLYRVVVNSNGRRHFPISAWMAFWLLSATSEQRCRAFVATMDHPGHGEAKYQHLDFPPVDPYEEDEGEDCPLCHRDPCECEPEESREAWRWPHIT